jgi:hypothetical protein
VEQAERTAPRSWRRASTESSRAAKRQSIRNPTWRPSLGPHNTDFGMVDLLFFAFEKKKGRAIYAGQTPPQGCAIALQDSAAATGF